MTSIRFRDPTLGPLLDRGPRAVWTALEQSGTFEFPALSSGLYSAALVHSVDEDPSGYRSAWVRDNVHIAYALYRMGKTQAAVDCARGLIRFFETQISRFEAAVLRGGAPADPMQRPHIRFDGERLAERPEWWAHAQNDAIGYFLWLVAHLVDARWLTAEQATVTVVSRTVRYLAAIRYWSDPDSGHWEEAPKVCASSVGTVLAGVRALRGMKDPAFAHAMLEQGVAPTLLEELVAAGERTLAKILPDESIDPEHPRSEDAALLFLFEPLGVLQADDPVGQVVLQRIESRLVGPFGVRRYVGDSYWSPNFRSWINGETPGTAEDHLTERDRRAVVGQEAQWALFDPTLCAIYARSSAPSAQQRRDWHFRRSLAQLTGPDDRPAPRRCVEAYFLEDEQWVPNDHVPLLWTQANLLLALQAMVDADGR